ncbi:nitronate monooxygenase [Dactylosporangium salmoneum]|uniref:Nitronate monooxygenase family protein n=1 Tax=Dactylosporangium salmoneum TaxID=53361 RepID=A0ABP5SVN9_9ACTN
MDFPVCGFSHCRDVVIALSKAGGLGVLGTARYSPEQFDIELTKIDEALDGRPYGVTIIFPTPKADDDGANDPDSLAEKIPDRYWHYVRGLADRFDIPIEDDLKHVEPTQGVVNAFPLTREHALAMLEVTMRHPVSLVSSAIGAPPRDAVDELHRRGVKVCGQVGDPKHVQRHLDAGVDIIVATGTEAGGHTGEIASLVLTPAVVNAAKGVPVLAAGGIGTGKQVTAALALGAAGVWMGSAWLVTVESDLPEELKKKLVAARTSDTIRSRSLSGRMARQLRTPWVDAWEEEGAPSPLLPPLQGVLVKGAQAGMLKRGQENMMGTPVGQIVGDLTAIRSVKDVVLDMMSDSIAAADRVEAAFADLR